MRLRPHQRNVVVWSSSAVPGGERDALRFGLPSGSRRLRRWIRIGSLLAIIGVLRLAAAVRPRWRHLLAGGVLTVAGVILRSGPVGVVLIPGLLFLLTAPLVPGDAADVRTRHLELERELAAYSTAAQRRDLEAIFDRYPDGDTRELRDILARQTMAPPGDHPPAARS